MFHQAPVRPKPKPPDLPGGGGEAAASSMGPGVIPEKEEEEEEEVDPKLALMDDPVVGVEPAGHEGPQPTPLSSPPSMTRAEKEKHDLTHQPPHRGCPICASSRTPNLMHAQSHEGSRTIPLLVGDDCFLKNSADAVLLTCLVLRRYPYRLFLTCGVPRKGGRPNCRFQNFQIYKGNRIGSFCLSL